MHTTGGYLTQVAFTHKYVFDLHPDTDIYWCAADIGWVTGHSYIVYGPLTNGATSVIYEGVPDAPGRDRLWDIAERYGVTILYTAPTAIRTFMKWGAQEPEKHDLSKLRLLGSVGEPINPEAWMWYHAAHRRRPVPDRRHVVADRDRRHHDQPAARAPRSSSPARRPSRSPASRPRWSTRPATASSAAVATSRSPARGRRCCAASTAIPSATRRRTGRKYEGRYFAGDGCKLDDDGYLWLLGRVDDVMNVSGHRISTTEVESALVDHPAVAEAAVVGANDAVTGQAIMAYVIVRGTHTPERRARRGGAPARRQEARRHRPAEDGDLHRRAAQDPLRQDHAAAAARRRRGPLARRHHHARRPERGRGDQAPGRRSARRKIDGPHPRALALAGRPGRAGPAVVFDMDGVLSDASGAPAPPRAAAPQLGRLLRGGRRGRADRGGRPAPRPPRPRPPDRAAHRPPDQHPAPHPRLARAPRPPLGPPRDARVGRLRRRHATSSRTPSASCGTSASTCASPSRTTAATSTCSTAKASPASTSTPATTSDALRSVPEVAELEGDAEVVVLQRGDHRLEVVALLAGDPELLTLHL